MKLTLKSESLTALTSEELTGVVGGALPTTPLDYCFNTLQATRCMCP